MIHILVFRNLVAADDYDDVGMDIDRDPEADEHAGEDKLADYSYFAAGAYAGRNHTKIQGAAEIQWHSTVDRSID